MKADQDAQAKQAEAEQMASETARAQLAKMQTEIQLAEAQIKKLGVDDILKKVQTMLAALEGAQIVTAQPGLAPAADEITSSAGLADDGINPLRPLTPHPWRSPNPNH
jgi:predicted  nucleic acid-binding Zn-ribbon protein